MAGRRRHIIGCMTGTSLDGLDAALVEVNGSGLEMTAGLVRAAERPLGECAAVLRRLAEGEPLSAKAIAEASLQLGQLHAEVASELADGDAVDLVAVHGQTVFHAPPMSWQLINPWPIVMELRCPVVSDLRGADLATGGEGAPITPLADWVLFRGDGRPRWIVNLGGFCNATYLPGDGLEGVRGFDICACNQLLDAAARQVLDEPFDRDGAAAMAGVADDASVAELVQMLTGQRSEGRSLGTGDEGLAWLPAKVQMLARNDLMATIATGVGRAIRSVLDATPGDVILAGGGVRNEALVGAMGTTQTSDALGVPIQARESMSMAVLGALAQDGLPITLPAVTRRGESVPSAGSWVFPAK